MTDNTHTIPFNRSQSMDSRFNIISPSAVFQTSHPLMTVERRSLEGALHIRDNLNNVINEIQPLVETARSVNAGSLFSLLNRPVQSEPNISRQVPSPPNEMAVINMDDVMADNANNDGQETTSSDVNLPARAAFLLNNVNSLLNETESENNNPDDINNTDRANPAADPRRFLNILFTHIPCVLILLVKCLYDHHKEIFNIVVLFVTFVYANSVVKNQTIKRGRRNMSKLRLALLYIIACILFIHYIFEDEKLYLNLVFVRTYDKPLSVWDLLWFVIITDFILKLITVAVKICLTMLPGKIIAFQERVSIWY